MWQNILINWQTSAAGFGLIMLGLGDVLTYAAKGQVTPNAQQDLGYFVAGIMGLRAKDSNVTGTGSK
jgi:hypothetical protein